MPIHLGETLERSARVGASSVSRLVGDHEEAALACSGGDLVTHGAGSLTRNRKHSSRRRASCSPPLIECVWPRCARLEAPLSQAALRADSLEKWGARLGGLAKESASGGGTGSATGFESRAPDPTCNGSYASLLAPLTDPDNLSPAGLKCPKSPRKQRVFVFSQSTEPVAGDPCVPVSPPSIRLYIEADPRDSPGPCDVRPSLIHDPIHSPAQRRPLRAFLPWPTF